jgi:amino acid adenylation domain-containing protein
MTAMPPFTQSANTTQPHCPSVHWLENFTRTAKDYPGRAALIVGPNPVSYGDLSRQADSIAALLASRGIGAGHFVGAGFHRSAALIAGLLGILKSGAAYVPLDPAYPSARIAQMTGSARLATILTAKEHAGAFPENLVVAIDDAARASAEPADLHPLRATDPIYAIFTSGSTGQPKAASVFHSGFANLLDWYHNELALGPDDRTLVISSPSFDLTQKNLFTPLLTGGTLILDDCQTYDITRILGLIRTHGVTLINCTPSAFYPLVDAAASDGFQALASLRFAVLGGEPISIPRLRAWLEHPSCRAEVVNSYGPTECTDICLFHRLHRGNLDEFPFVPLGREIPNVDVTIRDENLAILPDGETGELCIGGAGVGGGYLHDPERTAERFVNGIYRSGDLAKRLPCGTFEFRGRADHQVKVNGFRIELGEIEIALNAHDSVREAVVTASGNKLTAHVQGSASTGELRAYLASRLPAYMIPAEFLLVENFPLTPNGKVDRKKLAEAQPADSPAQTALSDTDLESRILALWSEILGHPVTDATANFFDLGGNSIHLAVVHVRLRDLTGRDFPITDLFALPNARAIAAHLSPQQTASAANSAQDRARLAKAGFSRFQRPANR